jgi:homocitrate synthase NifV
LSCLDKLPPDKAALSRFLSLLAELDPGAIELSEAMYRLLSPLPKYPSYVLRLTNAADVAKYPYISEFICPKAAPDADVKIRAEISIISADNADAIADDRRAESAKLRVTGLDGALRGDYQQTFSLLKRNCGSVEFCPANRFHCATALAAEWALSGAGDGVVTAFGGIGGLAATEELIMILRMNNLRSDGKTYGFLREMASLFKKIAKKNVPPNKPVIGKRLFHVESGIHVDGLLKRPACYEPFQPETVGLARKIVLGKQSGIASIRAKLAELKLRFAEEELQPLLARVKAKAAEKRGAVTDKEFSTIAASARRDDTNVHINDATSIHCGNNKVLSTKHSLFSGGWRVKPAVTRSQTITAGALPQRHIVDTTLRDGEQTPGLYLSSLQKLEIAALLDSGGVGQIEAGVPATSIDEKETLAKLVENSRNAVISVWSRLVPSDIEHAIDVRPDLIHICVPVSQTQIREKLRIDEEQVTVRLRACLRVAGKSGIPLSVGFEDAFRADAGFMITVAKILLDFGVTRIRISDTVGVASPSICRALLKELGANINGKAALGIHAHNDLGMAVANTVEAAKSGCLYADVTAGGIGERAGNCGLAQLVRASSSIFDWGMTAAEARELEREIGKVIGRRLP